MAGKFLFRCEMRSRWARLADCYRSFERAHRNAARVGDKAKADLPSTSQFDINLGQKLRVEEGTVLHPVASIDPKPHAEGIEAMLCTRMLGPSEL